jgi:hypothetical protein
LYAVSIVLLILIRGCTSSFIHHCHDGTLTDQLNHQSNDNYINGYTTIVRNDSTANVLNRRADQRQGVCKSGERAQFALQNALINLYQQCTSFVGSAAVDMHLRVPIGAHATGRCGVCTGDVLAVVELPAHRHVLLRRDCALLNGLFSPLCTQQNHIELVHKSVGDA